MNCHSAVVCFALGTALSAANPPQDPKPAAAKANQPNVPPDKPAKTTPDKPIPVPSHEIAVLADYKGDFKTKSDEFRQFGEKYNKKVVTVSGSCFFLGAEKGDIHFLVKSKDPKSGADLSVKLLVFANVDGVNDKWIRDNAKASQDYWFTGTVTGMFTYDPEAGGCSVRDAVLNLKKATIRPKGK